MFKPQVVYTILKQFHRDRIDDLPGRWIRKLLCFINMLEFSPQRLNTCSKSTMETPEQSVQS